MFLPTLSQRNYILIYALTPINQLLPTPGNSLQPFETQQQLKSGLDHPRGWRG